MDFRRAKEIAASPAMVNVTVNGVPIYIESVGEDNTTAYVHPLHHPDDSKQINLSDLLEP